MKPSNLAWRPTSGGGAEAIFQASHMIQATPIHRMTSNSGGQNKIAEPRPALTSVSINAKPTAIPSMCGIVARSP